MLPPSPSSIFPSYFLFCLSNIILYWRLGDWGLILPVCQGICLLILWAWGLTPPFSSLLNFSFYAGFFQTPVLRTVVRVVESALSFVNWSASILSAGIHVILSTFWHWRWSLILSTSVSLTPLALVLSTWWTPAVMPLHIVLVWDIYVVLFYMRFANFECRLVWRLSSFLHDCRLLLMMTNVTPFFPASTSLL